MPESFEGTIVRGDGRGRTLGFPTANIQLPAGRTPPAAGIYAAYTYLPPDPKALPAVVHCGPRPTFPGSAPSFEVHLLSFPDQDLYDRVMRVEIVQRLRGVKQFPTLDALRQAIETDIQNALEIFSR